MQAPANPGAPTIRTNILQQLSDLRRTANSRQATQTDPLPGFLRRTILSRVPTYFLSLSLYFFP
jgi:hypothetical protein